MRRASFIVVGALLGSGCGPAVEAPSRMPVVLARIDSSTINDVEFDEALSQWKEEGISIATPAQWRKRLQLLIDRRLLVMEARELGFYDDPRVLREAELLERSRLIPQLLGTETGAAEPFTEDELHEFYYATGANRELLVGRLVLDDKASAAAALKDVRGQVPFARSADTYAAGFADSIWLNRLAVGDERLGSLMSRFVGDAEMFPHDGRYLVAVVLDERSVALEERRPLAEQGLRRERQQEANLAYLASLMRKYEVYVDSAALTRLVARAAAGRSDPHLRLVRSTLGHWTAGQYRDASARLPAGQRPEPGSVRDLKLHVLRTFAVDQLLAREVEEKGLAADLARQRAAIREQKAIEALWAAKGLSRITVTEVELRRYFVANRDRYARTLNGRTAAPSVRAKVLHDLKEARAAPLFDEYVAELRNRYHRRVSVNGELFRAFVARKTGAPLHAAVLNGCDQLSAVDATGKGEVEIHFGGHLGYAYQPDCAAVSSGTIVTFVGDFGAHPLVPGRLEGGEVIPDDASPLRSTVSGTKVKFLMSEPGTHGYYCDSHVADAMAGAVFVE